MEPMRLRVQSVNDREGGLDAVVIAVSRERLLGKPRASLELQLRLEALEGESTKSRLTRVREEALRYLDID